MIQLCNHNKSLWKGAYDKEYYGPQDLPAWNVIDEATYQKIRPIIGAALPPMAISTIKYDQDDPHTWSSEEVFAPVMTMLELR
eukprot:10083817-Ditylum_brightwellii.AAC.1